MAKQNTILIADDAELNRAILRNMFEMCIRDSPKTAEADACRIEHIISDESFSRLKEAAAQEQE